MRRRPDAVELVTTALALAVLTWVVGIIAVGATAR